MWQYQNTDELYHYGIPGMRWGIRRQRRIEGRKQRSAMKLQKMIDKGSSQRKINKYRRKNDAIQRSRYGQTNGQILKEGVKRSIKSDLIAGVGAGALVLSGAAFTGSALAIAGAIGISAATSMYKTGNAVNTVRKICLNDKKVKIKSRKKQQKKKK
jgi:hypothetical protein